jgi:hypothetical protein
MLAPPVHILEADALTDRLGPLWVLTLTLALAVQLLASVAVTV